MRLYLLWEVECCGHGQLAGAESYLIEHNAIRVKEEKKEIMKVWPIDGRLN